MAKNNQTKILGPLTDFQTHPPVPVDERFDKLERRLIQVELLLSDVIQQLDQPYRDQSTNGKSTPTPKKAKAKATGKPPTPKKKKPKPPSPAEKILSAIGDSEMARLDVCEAVGIPEQQATKAWTYLVQRKLIEKTEGKDSQNRSLWKATGKKL